jgi:phenylalanyl-tRNA synthetase beta chain
MKFSYNWLCELVEGMNTPPKQLGLLLTMKTAECEGVEEVSGTEPECPPDSIIEIDNKSLTHRPDLWGHYGLAREVGAIVGGKLRDPVHMELLPQGPPPIAVSINDMALCPRYSALALENVTVRPSPRWLQRRLEVIGLNPINNVVDVTNYVMAELAQPLHAFDWDLLRGSTILIRTAQPGEHLVALNEQEYALDPRDLVIADERGPIALAGVIGGLDTCITDRTRRIVLESANFQAASIRRTSSRHKLRTDASMRFEKAQDPANTVRGLARALELLQEFSPGIRVVAGVADQGRLLRLPEPILLPLDWLARKLGKTVDPEEVKRIFERLGFLVSPDSSGAFMVTPPSWRATKDISLRDDLLEEVGRMIGYDSIPSQPPTALVSPPLQHPERLFHRQVRATLVELGFTEVYNYSFVSEEQAKAFGYKVEDHVRIANPIASDQCLMRLNLLPGIWKNIQQNSKHFENFRLFEIGREIHKSATGLPQEIPHLVAAVFRRDDGQQGLMELKRVSEHLMPGSEVMPASARPYEHPARTADVNWHGTMVGRLFELHPSMAGETNGRAAILDLDLKQIESLMSQDKRYTPLRRFPSSAFDLSVIAQARDLAGTMQKHMAALVGECLESIEFVRQYSGPPLPEGKKSVSFRLKVASPDHTLSSEELAAIRQRIIDGMRTLGYDFRL